MLKENNMGKIHEEIQIQRGIFTSIDSFSKKISELLSGRLVTTDLITAILTAAIDLRASDIHFEPTKNSVLLRFRIDGIMNLVGEMSDEAYQYILNRIKLLSSIKFNLGGAAADGRFTVNDQTEDSEVRVAISPAEYGEAIIMRILDPRAVILTVQELGLREDDYLVVQKYLAKPSGVILVTGPTGSGKTTTLYSFLHKLSSIQTKIITIEDPIEYHLSGIQQTQVNLEAGYSFESGLKSILRQDPDIILVGEIRDSLTAETAMNASLTGHLVFSTLHTNSASGTIPRLIDMKIKPQVLGSALSLIIAQRLVRKLCPFCKEEVSIEENLKNKLVNLIDNLPSRIDKSLYTSFRFYNPKGCEKCSNGYHGRIGIFEVVEITKDYENLIRESPSEYDIELFASSKGLVKLQMDGLLKVMKGDTSLEEIIRVTGPIEYFE